MSVKNKTMHVIPFESPQKSLVKMATDKDSEKPNPSMLARRSERLMIMTGRRPTLSASHPQK